MKRLLLATAALVGVAIAQNAAATTATSSIAASATVSTVCAMTTTPLSGEGSARTSGCLHARRCCAFFVIPISRWL